jgi:apolipoprotein N-acyltransferase
VTFLVVMVNAAVAELVLQMPGRKILFVPSRARLRSTPYVSAVLSAILVLASCVYGTARVLRGRLCDGPRVALIQGAVPTPARSRGGSQEAAAVDARLREAYTKLTGEVALAAAADVIIWPESALPGVFGDGSIEEMRMRELSSSLGLPILFGVNAYVRGAGSSDQTNSAVMLRGGELAGRYDKEHLVPFGEYIPFGSLGLRLLRKPFTGDYAAGREPQRLLDIGPWKAGVTICYEDVFAPLVRRRVLAGADLVVNLTNDSWFDSTAEPTQHCQAARLRAIELGVSLVRATNTGVTCVIDPYGGMATGPEPSEKGRLVAVVKLRPARALREAAPGDARAVTGSPEPTWYLAHGELFALSCGASTAMILAAAALRRRPPPPPPAELSAPRARLGPGE